MVAYVGNIERMKSGKLREASQEEMLLRVSFRDYDFTDSKFPKDELESTSSQ